MRIFNNSGHDVVINGHTLNNDSVTIVGEMAFNSQPIFSDIGAVEIITEYSRRSFRCYGGLGAFENKKVKDAGGLPEIVIINTIPQRLYKGAKGDETPNQTDSLQRV